LLRRTGFLVGAILQKLDLDADSGLKISLLARFSLSHEYICFGRSENTPFSISSRFNLAQCGLIATRHEVGILNVLLTFAELFQLPTECSLSSHAGEQDLKEWPFRMVFVRWRWIRVETIWISVGFLWTLYHVLVVALSVVASNP
jgi:hypothetical protein